MKALKKLSKTIYRCRTCGMCGGKVTGKVPYVCPVKEATPGFEHFYARGKVTIARGLLEGRIDPSSQLAEAAYSCTLCGNCMTQCGASDPDTGGPLVDTLGVVEALRADLLEAHPEWVDPAYRGLLSTTRQYDNPWGVPRSAKAKWSKNLSLPQALKTRAQVLLFVGCTTASNPALHSRAAKAAEILKKANVEFAVLGKDEPCCGSVQKRVGDTRLAEEMIDRNIDLFDKTGCQTIVTLCAGCANALKNDYAQTGKGLDAEVRHIVEFIAELLKTGRLSPSKRLAQKVAYHDPCHLGRHMGIYDPPRDTLNALPGVELIERPATRENTICCGAGGGLRLFESGTLAEKIGQAALESAARAGAEAVASACPFCEMNLAAAAKMLEPTLPVCDIIDLVHARL